MQALESYPSHNRKFSQANDTNNDEYAHVRNYAKGNRTCGTLSKSEWEASCKFI